MQDLEITCTWNSQQNQAKVTITKRDSPTSLFGLPKKVRDNLLELERTAMLDGPKCLIPLEEIATRYPNSLYAAGAYHQTLMAYQLFDDAWEFAQEIQKHHPDALLTRCFLAAHAFRARDLETFKEHLPEMIFHLQL